MVRTAAGEVVPRIEAPLVDKLVIRVVVDGAHDIFIPEQTVPDIAVAQARMQGGEKFRRSSRKAPSSTAARFKANGGCRCT